MISGMYPAPILLHLDMDSFVASVEVREHPGYRGKHLVVGADPKGGKGRGVVSTASYEARKFGLHAPIWMLAAASIGPQYRCGAIWT